MNPVSIGLIGAGFHVQSAHIPALDAVPELRLAAIATSREETALAAAARYRIKGYADYRELLDRADIEAVIVATPPELFDAVTKAALERGKHVLLESPGVGSIEAARQFQKISASKKLVVQVGFSLRYAAPFELLKNHTDSVREPRIFCYDYYPFLSHIYNLALYLSGPFDRVLAATRDSAGSVSTLRFKNGDTATVIGRSVANCSIQLESVRVSSKSFYASIESRTHVRIIRQMEPLGVADWSLESSGGAFYDPHVFANRVLKSSGYEPQLSAFARAIREAIPPRSMLEDAIQTKLIAEEIAKASALTVPAGSVG
jgi:predicted dehydrogenase